MSSSASRRSRDAVSGVSRSSCRTSTAPGKAAATRNERVRIHLLPGVIHDRMSSRLEGFDDSREEAGDRLREELHVLAERFVHPIGIGPQVRAASVERPNREAPLAFHDDVVLAVRVSLTRDDCGFGADPARNRVSADLVAIEDQGNPERLIVLEAASDHLPVPRLEHVQRQRGLGKQDRMEREESETHRLRPFRRRP